MTIEDGPTPHQNVEPTRGGGRLGVLISVVSAIVSVASLAVAWSALNAYPSQLKMTERLRVCIAIQSDASEFVTAVTSIEGAIAENDLDAYRRATDLAIGVDRRVSQYLGMLSLLGPPELRTAAERVRDKAEAYHDAAAVLEQRDEALSDEIREYGLALRHLNEECARALQ
ncbi:MAG: hypothetical protein AB7G40_08350 [Hyphomonadaceae bacterium]